MRDVYKKIENCQNKIVANWIKELHTEAVQKRKKSTYVYERLLRSIAKYPAPLFLKKDFLVLDGCGDFIAQKIEKMIKEKLNNKLELLHPCKIARVFLEMEKRKEEESSQNKIVEKSKESLDILKLIYKKGPLYIEEIDRMISLPKNIVLRTTLELLQKEGLLIKTNEKHSLSEEALNFLHKTCLSFEKEYETMEKEKTETVSEYETETWDGDKCELCLVYDTREFKTGSEKLYAQERMKNEGIRFLEQQLPIGDFIWVIKQKEKTGKKDIGVLSFIVERKKGKDLIDSIKDGRFIEQKQRIKSCGFERAIYLVEEMTELGEVFASEIVANTITKTRLKDKFHVVKTSDIEETFDMLSEITKELKKEFLKKEISVLVCKKGVIKRKDFLKEKKERECILIEYTLFSQITGKNVFSSVRELFLRMLIKIPSMTTEKALCLVSKYPTINSLRKAYLEIVPGKRKKMLETLLTERGKLIGKTLSKKIAFVFGHK